MAHNGIQKLHPVRLVRGGVQVRTSFKGKTEANIMELTHTVQEYGNTKFTDERIIYCYFKEHFSLTKSAIRVGYSVKVKQNGRAQGIMGMDLRVKAMNPISVMEAARDMIKHHLITLEDIQIILKRVVNRSRTVQQKGGAYKLFAKKMVTESIAKFGTRTKAAQKLGILLSDVNYWADLEV